MSAEILKLLRILLFEELAEISKNTKLLENISNIIISNKSYETHNPLQNLSSSRRLFQNIEDVQNKNNDSSPQCTDWNTPIITKNRKIVSKRRRASCSYDWVKHLMTS